MLLTRRNIWSGIIIGMTEQAIGSDALWLETRRDEMQERKGRATNNWEDSRWEEAVGVLGNYIKRVRQCKVLARTQLILARI